MTLGEGDHVTLRVSHKTTIEYSDPVTGWMGVDPTNRKLVDWQYVRTAIGRDYFDVPPNRGIFRGMADQRVDVQVHIDLLQDNSE